MLRAEWTSVTSTAPIIVIKKIEEPAYVAPALFEGNENFRRWPTKKADLQFTLSQSQHCSIDAEA